MQAYRVDGSLRQGKTNQEFCIDIVAEDEDDACHHAPPVFQASARLLGVEQARA